ncbi:MAG: hypothetical protein J1E34_06405 [Oscillospiraceae bacterium]|nr:hypothetical protein [Oscillospiraceae bacterium]
MCQNYITPHSISVFENYLCEKEKSKAAIKKYLAQNRENETGNLIRNE